MQTLLYLKKQRPEEAKHNQPIDPKGTTTLIPKCNISFNSLNHQTKHCIFDSSKHKTQNINSMLQSSHIN